MSANRVYQYSGPKTATFGQACNELGGVMCSSSSSGTLTISEGTVSGGAAVVAVFTLVAGAFYPLLLRSASGQGFYFTIGATANICVLFN